LKQICGKEVGCQAFWPAVNGFKQKLDLNLRLLLDDEVRACLLWCNRNDPVLGNNFWGIKISSPQTHVASYLRAIVSSPQLIHQIDWRGLLLSQHGSYTAKPLLSDATVLCPSSKFPCSITICPPLFGVIQITFCVAQQLWMIPSKQCQPFTNISFITRALDKEEPPL